jgi:hypothetical protein
VCVCVCVSEGERETLKKAGVREISVELETGWASVDVGSPSRHFVETTLDRHDTSTTRILRKKIVINLKSLLPKK